MNFVITRQFRGLPREVAVVTAISFCVALGYGIVAPVLPVFAESFGVSAFAASAVISLFALMRFVSASPSGWLVNKFGERWVLGVGLSIVSVSSALAGSAQTYPQLLILRAIGGTGSAMFTVAAMSLLLHKVDSESRGRATSLYQSGFLFGGLAGPAVGGIVVHFSIRAPFFVYSATLLAAVITALSTLDKLPRSEVTSAEERIDQVEVIPVRQALREHPYRAALTVNLITSLTSFSLRISLIPLFVTEALNRDTKTASISFLISSVMQAVLLPTSGRFIDTRGRKPALILGSTILTTALVVLATGESLAALYLSMLLFGISAAYLGAAPSAIVGDVVKDRKGGQVIGLFQMVGDFGVIMGPLVAGYLKDSSGGYFVPFATAAAASLFAFYMSIRTRETRIKPEQTESNYNSIKS